MRNQNTWHFKLPRILLLPIVDQFATQQNFLTLKAENIKGLLTLFKTFSAYSDLPLGLNPKRRQEIRDKLQQLKQTPNAKVHEIRALVNKIKNIKKNYQQRKKEARQQGLPIFIAYENEDLIYIVDKILNKINYYISHATQELKHVKLLPPQDHPFHIFGHFIKNTKDLLEQHQSNIAHSMLLRLQQADKNNSLNQLSQQDFIRFHQYIYRYGNRKLLNKLFWIKDNIVSLENIIKPKKPRWPNWFFRTSNILHRAFNNSYHQASLLLTIRKLDAIDTKDTNQLPTVKKIHRTITQEIQRLNKLRNQLFRFFHRKQRAKLAKRIHHLSAYQRQATRLYRNIETQVAIKKAAMQKKQQRRALIQQRVNEYDAETRQMRHIELLKKLPTLTRENFSEINELIQKHGERSLQIIWQHHLDQYRLSHFMKIVLDPEHSQEHLNQFLSLLAQTTIPFPATLATYQQLENLMKHLPTPHWTRHQHHACEAIDANPILSKYYQRALNCPLVTDLIIEHFAREQLTEIEFPELKEPLDKAIKRRLIEKEAKATAKLIQAEVNTGQINSAINKLSRLQHNLYDKKQKQKAILVIDSLLETAEKPKQCAQQLQTRLQQLLKRKTTLPNYLETFDELKSLAEKLPCTTEYLPIKRLCAAGPTIPHILNKLSNTILAFASGEIESITGINELLLDIIDADLINSNKKNLLLQLIDATLLDPQNSLPTNEKKRLISLKNCLEGIADHNDRAAVINKLPINRNRSILFEQSNNNLPTGDTQHVTIQYIP